MAPTHKLSYFNIHALGEPIRLIFTVGGIEFEDFRIERDQWPAIKPTAPFGQLPMLEVDGKKAHQSIAICRYAAKKANLLGKDDWENLEIDAVVDTITDFRKKNQEYQYEQNPEKKQALKETVLKEALPFYYSKFDNQVKNNGGYFVGNKLTWADVYFVGLLEFLDYVLGTDTVSDYPNLTALKEKILGLPSVKLYLSKRPPPMKL